jgi:hypothetical protein
MGYVRLSIVAVAGLASILALGIGPAAAQDADPACAARDVVPNLEARTTWKYGPALAPCVVAAGPSELPMERIDTPPNLIPRTPWKDDTAATPQSAAKAKGTAAKKRAKLRAKKLKQAPKAKRLARLRRR